MADVQPHKDNAEKDQLSQAGKPQLQVGDVGAVADGSNPFGHKMTTNNQELAVRATSDSVPKALMQQGEGYDT